MHFKQFYLGCLAQASYILGSDGEAAVVDPRRDVDIYIEEARRLGLEIRFVIETHLHADFVSGHRELAERTGATILFGQKANAALAHRAVREGEEVRLGKIVLRFLETPGHTPESISILVTDTEFSASPRLVLTGDTLFIGDVGRPDLAGGAGFTPEAMAGMLFDSLHEKLLKLPDAVEVYPAHGAGSLCGRNMSKETSSTIGEQRRGNYALQPMAKEAFVRMMTADLPEVPAYFPRDAALNRQGAGPLGDRPEPKRLDPASLQQGIDQGGTVLDVRDAAAFGNGHVPGSINIALAGQFASWAGTILDPAKPLFLVCEDDSQAPEATMRLARVGFEPVAGFLGGGTEAWDAAGRRLARLDQLPVNELHDQMREGDSRAQVLDVRRPSEFAGGHVPGAVNVPLDRLAAEAPALDPTRPVAVVCAGGYRSSAASSLLLRRGFSNLTNVVGGTSAWVAAGYETQKSGPGTDEQSPGVPTN